MDSDTFTERLWPSAGVLLFGWGVAASLSLGFAKVYGATAGAQSLAILTVAYAVFVVASTPVVSAAPEGLRAGRATLPREVIGRVRVLSADETSRALGAAGDQTAFLMTRGWIAQSVIVTVNDSADPHPYWHVSSRHPQRLAAALQGRP